MSKEDQHFVLKEEINAQNAIREYETNYSAYLEHLERRQGKKSPRLETVQDEPQVSFMSPQKHRSPMLPQSQPFFPERKRTGEPKWRMDLLLDSEVDNLTSPKLSSF